MEEHEEQEEPRYFFVFCYGDGSFGFPAENLREAREIFRKRITGEVDFSGVCPRRKERYLKRIRKFAESGIDVDSIEPGVYQ